MYKHKSPAQSSVTGLLAVAGRINHLAKVCPAHCQLAYYRHKHKVLALVITSHAAEFEVDSVLREQPLILGIRHLVTGRRFHVLPGLMPSDTRLVLQDMAAANGLL